MTEQQPEQEPVAYMRPDKGHLTFHKSVAYVPLYTAPPKREWVGLSDTEVKGVKHMKSYYCKSCDVTWFVKPIQIAGKSGYVEAWACCCTRCGNPGKEVK